jgi:outer membrane immunogenic protein
VLLTPETSDQGAVGVEANYLHGRFRAFSSSIGITFVNNIAVAVTNTNATVQVLDFGSLRVRGGYIIGCFLPYLFGGVGFGSQTVERNVSAFPAPVLPAWIADTKTKLVYGYSAGVGVDVMLVGGLFATHG